MPEGIVITRKTGGEQPPVGMKGTADKPYDMGNAGETETESGSEPPNAQEGAGTATSPHDGGNAPENTGTLPIVPSTPPQQSQSIDTLLESPSTTHQGSGLPDKPPTEAQTKAIIEDKAHLEAAAASPASVEQSQKSTGLAASSGDFDAASTGAGKEASRLKSLERDVSPGTMPDGSHAVTSGDRGESYEPSTMSKFKGKLGFGGKK